ncbi:hypothetical protein JCM5353_006221 [Sporobolomyces roseus]
MDRLPIELLRHIVDSLVDFDIRTPTSQTALATLAQVNKTLNAIVIPRLYLHPVLTSKERALSWATFYSSKASISEHVQDWQAVRDVVVPHSLTFSPICGRAPSPSPGLHPIDSIADILFPPNSSISSSFFFRNLTSFTVYPERLLDVNFTAALFGPTSYNRETIVDLSIRSGGSQWHLILFLLDAHRHFPSEPSEGGSDEETREGEENGRERTLTSGSSFREEEDSNRTSSSIDDDDNDHGICSVFNRHSLLEDETRDFLPYVLSSRSIPVTPFANLVNLSLSLFSNAELFLIFLTPLFPVLRTLKLDGQIWTTNHIEDDIAMFRYSITERQGRIYPPMVDEDVQEEFSGVFDFESWTPLTQREMKRYPWKPYDGPNLDVLDLTECEVQWRDEP